VEYRLRCDGLSGLSRLLLVFIQITIVILPIFILITTVKSISADRESNILEYMLSFPISLKEYYWGKFLGRFVTVLFPLLTALSIGVVWGLYNGGDIPWRMVTLYSLMVLAITVTFLGIAFFISTIVSLTILDLHSPFGVWITLLGLIDVALIGLMMAE